MWLIGNKCENISVIAKTVKQIAVSHGVGVDVTQCFTQEALAKTVLLGSRLKQMPKIL